jgi:hypothetical protein
MAFGKVLDRFVELAPVTVMHRGLLENVFSPEKLNAIFHHEADAQYQRELLFSTVVDLTAQVVCRVSPSTRAAYTNSQEEISVALASVYNKLQNVELQTSEALVRHTAVEARLLISKCKGQRKELLPGYRVRILDGNHLGKTHHRIEPLRNTAAGALPGQSLVLLDPKHMLIDEVVLMKDGHAQERTGLDRIKDLLEPSDLLIADRNFCTVGFMLSIIQSQAYFVLRQHKTIIARIESLGKSEFVGKTDTGEVYQEPILVRCAESGQSIKARRIAIHLNQATENGDKTIYVISNLPAKVKATNIACLYRTRWKLEHVFNELTTYLNCEMISLGYPQAALFGFSVAVCCYNLLAALQGVLRGVHGQEKIETEVSSYYLVQEVQRIYPGMMLYSDAKDWTQFQSLSIAELAKVLKTIAKSMDLSRYPKAPTRSRKPKKNLPKAAGQHISTHRALNPDEFHAKKKQKIAKRNTKISP